MDIIEVSKRIEELKKNISKMLITCNKSWFRSTFKSDLTDDMIETLTEIQEDINEVEKIIKEG